MNERSRQFKEFVERRMETRAYKRTARWIRIRVWFYALFHPRRNSDNGGQAEGRQIGDRQ